MAKAHSQLDVVHSDQMHNPFFNDVLEERRKTDSQTGRGDLLWPVSGSESGQNPATFPDRYTSASCLLFISRVITYSLSVALGSSRRSLNRLKISIKIHPPKTRVVSLDHNRPFIPRHQIAQISPIDHHHDFIPSTIHRHINLIHTTTTTSSPVQHNNANNGDNRPHLRT